MSEALLGFTAPWAIYAGVLLLHLVLPARRVDGYVRDERSGAPLRYRLNGLLVLVVCVALWAAAGGYAGVGVNPRIEIKFRISQPLD